MESIRRICDTCKHNPPSKKWPCMDCDMREPADRWEAQDVPDTNVGDMISRQAAIELVDWYQHEFNECDYAFGELANELSKLPSAQPDPLTDKEQRIFLAAMEREEKACKQVDDECRDCREPYEDSLVRVCREIERKVKGALWTN